MVQIQHKMSADLQIVNSMSELSLSPVRRIPPELVVIVLAHLDGPEAKRDLLSWSTVSRDWYGATRQFLFEELLFTVCDRSELDTDVYGDPHSAPAKPGKRGDLKDLLEFLDISPHIRPYVRSLDLSTAAGYHQDLYPNIDPTILVGILRQLPLLEFVELYDILFLPSHYNTWKKSQLHFPGSIQRLAISFGSRAGDMDSFDDALHLLDIFSGDVGELCLSTIYAVGPRIPYTRSLSCLRIGSLVVDEVTDIGPLMRAVSESPSVWSNTLKSIYLSWINMKDLRSATCLLDGIRGNLVNFGCNLFPLLDSKPADAELFQIFDFSEMHNLQSVTLGLVLLPDASWNANIWRDVCRILSSLPPSRASQLQVCLELCIDRLNHSSCIALASSWKCLDSTMQGRCKSLKLSPARKKFYIPIEDSFNTNMQEHISEMLPELTKAKVLQF